MSSDLDIIPLETSDRVRNTVTPFIQLRSNGDSYMSARAARLLGFEHGHVIRFFKTSDPKVWYISNDPVSGANIKKVKGLHRFCDVVTVRKIFEAFDINATRADFPVSPDVDKKMLPDGSVITVLFIIPKPYNIK